MSEEALELLARVLSPKPYNKQAIEHTKDLLAEGLVDQWLVRHMVRHRGEQELQEAAREYYDYCNTESYRTSRVQQQAKRAQGRGFWNFTSNGDSETYV